MSRPLSGHIGCISACWLTGWLSMIVVDVPVGWPHQPTPPQICRFVQSRALTDIWGPPLSRHKQEDRGADV